MSTIGWAVLAPLVAAETWVHLNGAFASHLVVASVLLALIGGLVIAVLAVGHRTSVVALVLRPVMSRKLTAGQVRSIAGSSLFRPHGGRGPRAPGSLRPGS